LTKKQLEAVLANQVAHNQDMHWHRGGMFGYEFELTDEIMRKVGMRKDYSLGFGCPAPVGGSTRADRRFIAKT